MIGDKCAYLRDTVAVTALHSSSTSQKRRERVQLTIVYCFENEFVQAHT